MFKENRRDKLITLTLSCFGLFMVLLDVTIVNNALPSIQRNLDTSLSGLQWIIDAYTLVFATLLLTTGALADRQGRKRWFMIGLAGFTLGSALCGLAPNLGVLVAARALQAAGGAAPGSAWSPRRWPPRPWPACRRRSRGWPRRSSTPAGRSAARSGSPCSARSSRPASAPPCRRASATRPAGRPAGSRPPIRPSAR
jgi:MFS family permease